MTEKETNLIADSISFFLRYLSPNMAGASLVMYPRRCVYGCVRVGACMVISDSRPFRCVGVSCRVILTALVFKARPAAASSSKLPYLLWGNP